MHAYAHYYDDDVYDNYVDEDEHYDDVRPFRYGRQNDGIECCCMDCLFDTFEYFFEIYLIYGGAGAILLFIVLLFTLGAPVLVFEYWINFLDSFSGIGNCSHFFSLII